MQMSPTLSTHVQAIIDIQQPRELSLESLPLECIQNILDTLSNDCHALYSLLLMNKAWFQMVLPFLYRSPMNLIDTTWPKMSTYSVVLKKDIPPPSSSSSSGRASSPTPIEPSATGEYSRSRALNREVSSDAGSRSERSLSNARGTSIASSLNSGYGYGHGYGYGYPRTHSRSSSHSSTRSWTADSFLQGRNDPVSQKDQRDRIVKRKKMQILWLLLNCTLTEEEHRLRELLTRDTDDDEDQSDIKRNTTIPPSSLLALKVNMDLDIDFQFFKPMSDYLSYYTHFYHPGLQFIIWKLFPDIEDSLIIEWKLICHCPERIRELFLESVQLQDMVPLVPRLKILHRIKACHESWDVPGSIEFMKQHNRLIGTVQMLELEAYLPDKHETTMDDNMSELISQVNHLKVLELAGFESLRAHLDQIPCQNLKVVRFNCGTLNAEPVPNSMSFMPQAVKVNSGDNDGRMSVSTFLSQCRQLEELLLDPVNEDMLEWAVQERRNSQVGQSIPDSLVHTEIHALVPLKVLELSGTDSEHVALAVSQAAEAFQDTLEVIKANSYSYESNRTLKNISWNFPMPKLQVLKVVGRSNLPLDFRSLQFCPSLKTLDLSKYSGMRACPESALLNLKYLTQLEYLGLSSFDHLTDSTLRTILGCMPKLTHLRLAIGNSNAASTSVTGSISTNAMSSGKLPGSSRNSGIIGGGSGNIGSSGGGTSSSDILNRTAFSALTISPPSTSTAGSFQGPSALVTPTPPGSLYQSLQSTGTSSQGSSSYNTHLHHYHTTAPISMATSSSYSPVGGISNVASSIGSISSQSGVGGIGEVASSARSTSSLLDRFYFENNYLSLEGILDAIDGLSETKNQIKKFSIVLGKLDFEEHFRRLELYNQKHLDMEITVYRYAHAV